MKFLIVYCTIVSYQIISNREESEFLVRLSPQYKTKYDTVCNQMKWFENLGQCREFIKIKTVLDPKVYEYEVTEIKLK